MYYISITPENELQYYCRNCGHENKNISLDSVTISKTSFKHNKQKYNSIINKYTKMDPTLPRINTIKCPNQSCSSNEGEKEKERDKQNTREVYDATMQIPRLQRPRDEGTSMLPLKSWMPCTSILHYAE